MKRSFEAGGLEAISCGLYYSCVSLRRCEKDMRRNPATAADGGVCIADSCKIHLSRSGQWSYVSVFSV